MIENDTSEPVASAQRAAGVSLGLTQRIRNAIDYRIRIWTQFHIGPISHVTTNEPVAALTFDDGPHPVFTPRLLDVFGKHGAHGTFFMLGEMARRHPELVREVAQRGHAVVNHTTNHPSMPIVPRLERWKQIRSCGRALAPYEQKFFRPPYGHRNLGTCIDAALLGYSTIAWNVHAFDWLDHDANWMAGHLLSELKPGCIVALHDALYHVLDEKYADRTPTIDAVELLLERMGKEYRFVTVPELLRYGTPQRQTCFGAADVKFLRNLKPNDGEVREYSPNVG